MFKKYKNKEKKNKQNLQNHERKSAIKTCLKRF